MCKQKSKRILELNACKDREELFIRMKLKDQKNHQFKLMMLIGFRPNASLRQIFNTIPNKESLS